MAFPKILALLTFSLFSAIAATAWWKHGDGRLQEPLAFVQAPMKGESTVEVAVSKKSTPICINRVEELFRTSQPQLPIVETITYKSHVPWLKGRQAWLSDYASHYHTSRHFIARSVNGVPDYQRQELAEGVRFNVFRQGISFQFNLVVDLSRCQLFLYYQDVASGVKELIKCYTVGIGRPDGTMASGSLTPLGAYLLGDKVAIFQKGTKGPYRGNQTQLIRVFGTRWIPFASEVKGCSLPANGYGIHGVPWIENERGELVEDVSSLGKSMSDGCIRLSTVDMEELFSIIITQPTVIELVREFSEACFPIVNRDS